MAWLSRVNFVSSDTLSFTDVNNLGNDIRAWGDNVNGGGYTLSNVTVSAAGITASGSLGVGTSTPSWQATVYGTGQNTAALTDAGSKSASLFVGSSNGTTGAGGSVLFGGIVANGVFSHWAIKSLITSTTANGTGDLAFVARAAAGDTSLTERMRIASSGNVGIGTPTPAARLHIFTNQPTAANEVARFQGGNNSSNYRNYISCYTTNPEFWWEISNEDAIGNGSTNGFAFRERSGAASVVRMYLAQGGNVCIGGSATPRKFTVYEGTAATADVGVRIEHASNKPAFMEFVTTQRTASFGLGNYSGTGNTGSMQLVCDGGFHVCPSGTGNFAVGLTNPSYQLQLSTDSAAKPSTNTWTIASDARLKTVLGDYEKGLDAICALRPVRYEYNGLGGMPADGKENISIVAQEAQEVFPECIGTFQGKLHEDDEEETELLNYNGHAVTFALINAVRELKARLDALA